MDIQTRFNMRDFVIIDGCRDIKAAVMALMVRGENITYQVSWVQDGDIHEPWIEEWRLSPWEE